MEKIRKINKILKKKSGFEWVKRLQLPLMYDGAISDGNGMTILSANRESGTTPLRPHERDELVKFTCDLLNQNLK